MFGLYTEDVELVLPSSPRGLFVAAAVLAVAGAIVWAVREGA